MYCRMWLRAQCSIVSELVFSLKFPSTDKMRGYHYPRVVCGLQSSIHVLDHAVGEEP